MQKKDIIFLIPEEQTGTEGRAQALSQNRRLGIFHVFVFLTANPPIMANYYI